MLALMLAMALSVSVRLSVTSRWSIEGDEWTDLVLAWGLFSTSPTLCCKEIQVSTEIRALPSETHS